MKPNSDFSVCLSLSDHIQFHHNFMILGKASHKRKELPYQEDQPHYYTLLFSVTDIEYNIVSFIANDSNYRQGFKKYRVIVQNI